MSQSLDDIRECIRKVKEQYPKRRLVPIKKLWTPKAKKVKTQNLPI